MRCRNCQRTIPATVKFCAYCGTAATTSAPPPTPPPFPPPGSPSQPAPQYSPTPSVFAGWVARVVSYAAAHRVQTIGTAAVGFIVVVLLLVGQGVYCGNGTPPPPPPDTPTPTPTPTATATPTPTPPTPTATPTPTPTATATPTPTPTPPTATPTPTPTPTATPTPTPPPDTPTPTPTPVCLPYEDTSRKFKMCYEPGWTLTSAVSAGGRPFLDIQVKDYQSGESLSGFFERHRQELIEMASNYSLFEPGLTRGELHEGRNYINFQYLLQPGPGDCLYQVVEHVFRSRFYPVRDYGFVLTAGICESEQLLYEDRREHILASFEEYQ